MQALTTIGLIDVYEAARAKVPVKVRLRGGRIAYRKPQTCVLLSLATFGLYGLYWQHAITRELRAVAGDRSLHAWLDTCLTLATLGLYSVYVHVRNARKIHGMSMYFNRGHRDGSLTLLLWMLVAIPSGFLLAHVSMAKLQRQMNELRELALEREVARLTPTRARSSSRRASAVSPAVVSHSKTESDPQLVA